MFRNLKKAQDNVLRTEKEIKDTEKEVDDLTTELKSLEDKAAEVVKNTNDAEVRCGEGRGHYLKQQRIVDDISTLCSKHSVGYTSNYINFICVIQND